MGNVTWDTIAEEYKKQAAEWGSVQESLESIIEKSSEIKKRCFKYRCGMERLDG